MPEEPKTNGLKRKLGLFPVTNIVVANMIGTGIFVTSGLLLADLVNPVLMILLWLIAGIMAFFGAMCYGELGAAFPQAGGEYIFLSKFYSPIYSLVLSCFGIRSSNPRFSNKYIIKKYLEN